MDELITQRTVNSVFAETIDNHLLFSDYQNPSDRKLMIDSADEMLVALSNEPRTVENEALLLGLITLYLSMDGYEAQPDHQHKYDNFQRVLEQNSILANMLKHGYFSRWVP